MCRPFGNRPRCPKKGADTQVRSSLRKIETIFKAPLPAVGTTWRGRAVEPVIRESLLRLLPDGRWPHAEAVGGWWNRQNSPEIDLIGADREPVAGAVHFIGSVKWLESHPFGRREYDALVRDMLAVPRRRLAGRHRDRRPRRTVAHPRRPDPRHPPRRRAPRLLAPG